MILFKIIFMALALLSVSACVITEYKATEEEGEYFKLTTFMKSVEGLEAKRNAAQFTIGVDSSHSQDPADMMRAMMDFMVFVKSLEDDTVAAPYRD